MGTQHGNLLEDKLYWEAKKIIEPFPFGMILICYLTDHIVK